MPYTLGADLLPEEKDGLKERLSPEEEEKLTADILELYDQLLPSAESDDRRRQLVRKLEKLFNDEWPGRDIKAHVFGSSGNKLCSSDSDVDICITTTYKELEHVCLLADVLAKHGMERVVCVSHAKVPIVKIWDPELRLACDMNVNNTLALENTRMVRTYVEVDERVRPLAMTVKYWTKRRVLNDAALGGTLSSYTWICLIINFLQTRSPPILPSLQARPHKKRVTNDGLVCSFDDNLESLAGFGRKNKQSLGDLLFQFFRYYGHEVDYEKSVISVREGRLISKEEKGWHLLQNNRLCVEEAFNTSRNLGNTADDTSFRGLHMELRRAFKAISKGSLEECCTQYEFPAEEERSWERPAPQPRAVITAVPPQYGTRGRGGGRGGRPFTRGGHSGRRVSNPAGKSANSRHSNIPTGSPELPFQSQHAQYLLHDHLFQQIQILQAQEQELRLQLQNQAFLTGRSPVLVRQPFVPYTIPQPEATGDENSRSRSGTVNHPPLTAPRQNVYYGPAYFPVAVQGVQGSSTNPPSPSAAPAPPDFRRNRRSSVANGSPGGSLRAQSQPARSLHSQPLQGFVPFYAVPEPVDSSPSSKHKPVPGSPPEGSQSDEEHASTQNNPPTGSRSPYLDENRPAEYVGYYLSSSPQLQAFHQNPILTPMSAPVGYSLQTGFYPYFGHLQDYRPVALSSNEMTATSSDQGSTLNVKNGSSQQRASTRPVQPSDRGPLIVDGSVPLSEQRSQPHRETFDHYVNMNHGTSNPEDSNINVSVSSDSISPDLQDNTSLENERPVFIPRQPLESHRPNVEGEARTYGINGGNSLLSNKMQSLHVSKSEQSSESPSRARPEKMRQIPFSNEGLDKTAPRLRPVTSVVDRATTKGPSPSAKRRTNGMDTDKANGSGQNKAKPRGCHELCNIDATPADSRQRHTDQSPRKQNNINSTNTAYVSGAAHNTGGWQTTKKKHRRNAKSLVETRLSAAEPLPVDESLRKGG
ncbi:hypothetical protein MPDQ_007760 [Monascus purpureus]|uniref:polynucleotide adenylyltransferase n=1 Tax=Monascus purpureus TaxID=5098 RepID=A0A507QVL8_MONPU|nr:hypothetical protein MPDQ_007760 [Monascus purpureus]